VIAPILFVCEGESDEAFFRELISRRRLKGCGVFSIRKEQTPGIDTIGERLKGLQAETGIEACGLVVVVADNDDSPTQRFSQVQKQIRLAGNFGIPSKPREIVAPINVPQSRHVPKIAVLMLPWDDVGGCLESICLEAGSAKRPGLAKCIASFVKCTRGGRWNISKLSKLKARCMLAVQCPKNPDVSFKWSWTSSRVEGDPFPVTQECFGRIVRYLRGLSRTASQRAM